MKKDYYDILGITKDASQDEIKKAFRQLAKKWHPDVNHEKGAEEKFKEINEAFQVLSDPQKKGQYDQYGHSAFGENFSGSGSSSSSGFSFEDILRNSGFGDIFRGFGGETQGADIRYDIELSLEDAFSGVEKKIEVSHSVGCNTCSGTGAKPGFLKSCSECGGSGEIRRVSKSFFAQLLNIGICHRCKGSGKTSTKNCDECHGKGKLKKVKKMDVKIPRGIDNDQYMKIDGEGDFGNPPGDLYVAVNIKEHEIFERRKSDLFCKTTIDMLTAILGGNIEVPTISGSANIKIPAGTQSHTVFRLKGQGMPFINSSRRGDQLVKVVVNIPEKLSKNQERLLKDFFADGADEEGGTNAKQSEKPQTKKGFFERLWEFM